MIFEDTLLTKSEYVKHAAGIAEKHRMGKCAFKNLPDAVKCAETIANTYSRILRADEEKRSGVHLIPPDEWIGDNYHLIIEAAEQLDAKRLDAETPGAKKSDLRRVYEIASEITGHTDGSISETEIIDFVSSYEKVRPLGAEELASLCCMLRLALLKRISEICKISDSIYEGRSECERIFREYTSYAGGSEREQSRSADILFENDDMVSPVFAETMLRLSAEQEANNYIRAALSKKLAAKGITIEELIAREHSVRISLGISAGNAIKSLQGLSSLDWDRITSELCVTEQILRRDPAGIFSKMTPRSRGEYVRLVRVCARRRGETPEDFALKVVEMADKKAKAKAFALENECERHVGTYIYEEYTKKNEFRSFRFMLVFIALILAFCPVLYTVKESILSYSWLGIPLSLFISVLIFTVSLGISLTIAQKMYMDKKLPFSLPELDFKGKLPEECPVMIVIPCLLSSKKHTDGIMKQIESAAWANPQKNMYYTVLADLPESKTKTRPEDAELEKYAKKCIEQLNSKLSVLLDKDNKNGKADPARFHIMIRKRTFYEKDNKWMGAERKRGALLELNRAIINGSLPRVKYVLTVDEGTVIPINTAVRMAQIMYHPLNRPKVTYVDSEPVVTKGYALLQSAVSPSGLGRENASLFEMLYSDDAGYDSYQCRTSDFYFDICHEGIYTGKGMYDPYVFNGILDGRFKDNSILSHDLIEGSFLRTAFVSDIHLYDSFPKNLASFAKRQHRWQRGDWQLIPFMGKRFEDASGVMRKNPLNKYSLFKMRMNLLRGVMPCAALLIFVLGMLLLSKLAFLWVLILLLYVLLSAGGSMRMRLTRAFFDLLFLPYTAYYHADAAVRALWRTFRSGKHMLDWVVSSESDRSVKDSPSYYCKMMWPCFVLAALMAPFLCAIPSILWLMSPYAAYALSRVPKRKNKKHAELPERSVREMRVLARKIWAFYDDFAGSDENYLPPDNVQFTPVYCVAHRTSPTNIGFLIISVIIAYIMGYISEGDMTERLGNIMDTIDKMDKWNGHIFNWYDTTTLAPLEPRYVSSVDSGNLCACLLAAASVLDSLQDNENQDERLLREAEGLLDTVCCLNELADEKTRVDAKLLEDFIHAKGSSRELYAILKYYDDNVHIIPSEKADAHSFRYKLMSMTKRLKAMLDGAKEYDGAHIRKELSSKMMRTALDMDFAVLYNKKRRQLHIGYNCSDGEFSPSYYDMLMSEARLTSYTAMAKGDVGEEHFTALARRWNDAGTLLLSWSGTVFEYILPELFMPSPYGSALLRSVYEMLDTEIKSAHEDRPWGVSESGYNVPDVNMNYKYKAFGLKELAVKRMQSSESVIAPYASVMSCAHVPHEVLENMDKLSKAGASGKYGFYEAVDYTPGRKGIVESFMAHHLGMSLCAVSNLLFDGAISKAFSEMPMMSSVSVMLTEKMPVKKRIRSAARKKENKPKAAILPKNAKQNETSDVIESSIISGRDAEVLSNGRYSTVLNGAGGGYSALGDIGLGIRREDHAVVFYMNGIMLSPVKCEQNPGRVEYTYYTEDADILQSVCVFQNENAELRRLRVTNNKGEAAFYNLTMYCELMLTKQRTYEAHPSYSGMFITTKAQTDIRGIPLVLRAKRRKHSPSDPCIEAYFALRNDDKYAENIESIMYDTDILSFKGRNADISEPAAFRGAGAGNDVLLFMNTGTVLNPCFAVNVRIKVQAGESVELDFILGMEDKCCSVSEIIERLDSAPRAFELARTRSLIENEHIALREGDAAYFRSFSSKLLYGRKVYPAELQKQLWGFGVSGDNPIITVMLRHTENAECLERLIRMWCFYSFRGIKIDLVLAVFDNSDYISPVRELADTLASRAMWGYFAVRGDIFVVVPKDAGSAAPLIEAANIVFWY